MPIYAYISKIDHLFMTDAFFALAWRNVLAPLDSWRIWPEVYAYSGGLQFFKIIVLRLAPLNL